MIRTKNLRGAQAVTANRLGDGAVVFLAASGAWSRRIGDCAVARTADEAAALMAIAATAAEARVIVAPYLFEVSVESGAAVPVAYREQIRAYGPSIPFITSARDAAQ